MYIASAPDFVQEISIPNRSDAAVKESINWFIAKYEPMFLEQLLGADASLSLKTGLSVVLPELPDADTLQLRDQVKTPLLNYIYCQYRWGNASQFTGSTETVGKSENSINVSPATKMCRVWNQMVDLNLAIQSNISAGVLFCESFNPAYLVYNGYVGLSGVPEIFKRINTFGI